MKVNVLIDKQSKVKLGVLYVDFNNYIFPAKSGRHRPPPPRPILHPNCEPTCVFGHHNLNVMHCFIDEADLFHVSKIEGRSQTGRGYASPSASVIVSGRLTFS